MYKIIKSSLTLFLLLFAIIGISTAFPSTIHARPSIKFSPSEISVGLNQEFSVEVRVNTDGNSTVGVGARIIFDPQVIQTTYIEKGTIMEDYPALFYDNEKGRVNISGIVISQNKTVKGEGLLGTVTFKAVSLGESEVKLEFRQGDTNDSNIAITSPPYDILAEVNNLKVSVVDEEQEVTLFPTSGFSASSTTSEDESTDTNMDDASSQKLSFLDKILNFFGLSRQKNTENDGTATFGDSVDPETAGNNFVDDRPTAQRVSIWIIIILTILLILAIIYIYRLKKKRSQQNNPPVIPTQPVTPPVTNPPQQTPTTTSAQ